MKEKLVDPMVWDLASSWLDDDEQTTALAHDKRVMSLAGVIQQAIEDWCEADEADNYDPPDPDGEEMFRDHQAEARDAMDAARRLK